MEAGRPQLSGSIPAPLIMFSIPRIAFSKPVRRWLMRLLLLAIVIITFQTGRSLYDPSTVSGGDYSLIFLVLLYVNLFLVLALGFLVIRNFSRLWLERRRRRAGSQLRTRMVILFVALSLLPTLVITILSVELLNRGVDSWFSERISHALSHSLEVARAYYLENQQTIRHDAEDIARNRTLSTALLIQGGDEASTALEIERKARGLDEIAIFRVDGTRIASAGDLPVDPMPDLSALETGSNRALMFSNDNGERVRAVVRLGSDLYLSTGRWIDQQILAQMETIETAFVDYNQLRAAHGLLKTNHTVTLILITLLLLLGAVWSGFRIADNITSPITSLVIGTRKVAAGDLSVKLHVTGDDELAILMASFNAMIRKLKENQEELQSSNDLLEERRQFMAAVVRNISSGVLAVNQHNNITLINPAANTLLGISQNVRASGHPYTQILPDSVLLPLRNLLNTALSRTKRGAIGASSMDSNLSIQIQIQGEEKPLTLLTRITLLADDHGHSRGFIATFDDLSEVLVAQRTRAWSEVARRIAHEIKNPLTPIQLWSQRMRRKYLRHGEEERRDWHVLDEGTNAIINQVEELRILVNEFSTFARLPRPSLRQGDINSALEEVMVLHKAELRQLQLQTVLSDSLPEFPYDRSQMKQVFTNLIANAVAAIREKFADHEDGISAGRLAINTSISENNQWVKITVSDNGPGIPPSERDRAFEPYFTTKKKGTGLGLAIVKKIVEDHGGSIRIRSSSWDGVAVKIQLPVIAVQTHQPDIV
ncbi:MAG: HAMP domain-containing protein [Magnetococcales bacterium]|nr:HAMP domain-containing protein [Magnetococcales bacterium]